MRVTLLLTLAATALWASSAGAFDAPKRKSGLWEITTSTSFSPQGGGAMQTCVDEKSDDMMREQFAGPAQKSCTRNDTRREGDAIVFDSVCKFGETTATTHGRITGKFDSAYRIESRSSYDPPLMGKKDGTTTIDAKWLGPCKAGQKPGDMIMPGMGTMNMKDLMKNQPGK